MNLKQCYQDKKEVVEKAMVSAYGVIWSAINDDDTEYELSTDEVNDLAFDLMVEYINLNK